MKKIIGIYILLPVLIFVLGSCTGSGTEEIDLTEEDIAVLMDKEHNAELSLDVAGVYEGILPCANCEGLETKIVLNEDKTAITYSKYKGKSDSVYEDKATWEVIENTLFLKEANVTREYIVGETFIRQLDGDGKEITGELAEMFILKKQQ